jgi:hypothetical protein
MPFYVSRSRLLLQVERRGQPRVDPGFRGSSKACVSCRPKGRACFWRGAGMCARAIDRPRFRGRAGLRDHGPTDRSALGPRSTSDSFLERRFRVGVRVLPDCEKFAAARSLRRSRARGHRGSADRRPVDVPCAAVDPAHTRIATVVGSVWHRIRLENSKGTSSRPCAGPLPASVRTSRRSLRRHEGNGPFRGSAIRGR